MGQDIKVIIYLPIRAMKDILYTTANLFVAMGRVGVLAWEERHKVWWGIYLNLALAGAALNKLILVVAAPGLPRPTTPLFPLHP